MIGYYLFKIANHITLYNFHFLVSDARSSEIDVPVISFDLRCKSVTSSYCNAILWLTSIIVMFGSQNQKYHYVYQAENAFIP